MKTTLYRARTLACALLASTAYWSVAAAPAFAQTSPGPLPPDTMVLTPGGVDLRSGTYKVDKTILSMGASHPGGIDFRRITRTYGYGEPMGKMGQFNHNWDIRFRRKTRSGGGGADVIVTGSELSNTFFDNGLTNYPFDSTSSGYARLTRIPVGSDFYYSMTTKDGTTVVSRPFGGGHIALASQITRADGTRYDLTYDLLGPSGAPRLRRVVSNAGYALVLEYHPNSGTNSFVSKACVLNLAQTVLPTNNFCPAGAPTASYAYSGQNLVSETDPAGAVWGFSSTFTNGGTPFQESYRLPGASTPYLTVHYDLAEGFQLAVVKQSFADGRQYDYSWTTIIGSQDGEPMSLVPLSYDEEDVGASVTFGVYRPNVYSPPRVTPGPETVTDGPNRTTTFEYCLQTCAASPLRSKTLPGGMKTSYLYDPYRNITKTTTTPNSGSSLPAIVVSATYDCSTMTFCSKPTSVVDPNNNQTDFTYSPTHGQILTRTEPAVNGVRPQTRYSYTQRYAWIASGSGGYVQSSAPIWLLTQESYCKTGAANASGTGCAISGDEVVTTYDYGPNNGPNNLRLRGIVRDAGGINARTCFSYDANGNRTSETSPLAGLGTCP